MPHRANLVAATVTEVLRKSNVIASSARDSGLEDAEQRVAPRYVRWQPPC